MTDNYPHIRDMIDFLQNRLNDEAEIAHEAIDDRHPGTHWQWVSTVKIDGKHDQPARPSDDCPGYLWDVSLRTVEQTPTTSVGPLPGFLIATADEVIEGAARHIAHHDPAHVLADIDWKRELLGLAAESVAAVESTDSPAHVRTYGHLAATTLYHIVTRMIRVYRRHPYYRTEWDQPYVSTAQGDQT